MSDDEFFSELDSLGFVFVQEDRRGVLQFARKPNRFLTEWVHDYGDDALFTWEFELGDWVAEMDWQIGAAETSFQILYPQYDVKIPRAVDAVATEIQRLEQRLSRLDLTDPSL